MSKATISRTIDGVERQITVNPKYAGTSTKPRNVKSSARKWIAGGPKEELKQFREIIEQPIDRTKTL